MGSPSSSGTPTSRSPGRDGSIASVGLVVEEVGEHERVRSRLRSFEALVDQATDFVSVAALDRRMLYLNPAGRALVGQVVERSTAGVQLRLPRAGVARAASCHVDGSPSIGRALAGPPRYSGMWSPANRYRSTRPCSSFATTRPRSRSSTASVMRDTREHDRLVRRLELQIERMPVALDHRRAAGATSWAGILPPSGLFGHSAAAAVGQRVHELLGCPSCARSSPPAVLPTTWWQSPPPAAKRDRRMVGGGHRRRPTATPPA